jgi:uncharacterized repeat protein (TIGR03847 family)
MLRTFENVSRFVVGTLGEPGSRSFWIQARSGDELVSIAAEKSQVSLLGERFEEMLREIRLAHPEIERPGLIEDRESLETPVIGDFRVGAIAIFFDEFIEKVQVDFREVDIDVDEDEIFEIDSASLDDVHVVRLYLSLAQVKSFAVRAQALVKAGRPPCPFCALPIDPLGHICARANGYRR